MVTMLGPPVRNYDERRDRKHIVIESHDPVDQPRDKPGDSFGAQKSAAW